MDTKKTFKDYLLDGKVVGETFVSEEEGTYVVYGINSGTKQVAYVDLGDKRIRNIGMCLEDIKLEDLDGNKNNL